MRAYEEVRAAYMRVFDFDGTIYDGESLFDQYLFSAKYNPKVLRYIAPVLRYAIKYKLGRATFDQMEYGVGKLCHGYLSELAESLEFEELVNAFWDQNMKRIKPGISHAKTMRSSPPRSTSPWARPAAGLTCNIWSRPPSTATR